jgi:nitrogen fixation/metabolism regulation signal transduction histidine kinase
MDELGKFKPMGERTNRPLKPRGLPLLAGTTLLAVFSALALLATTTEDPALFSDLSVPLFTLVVLGVLGLVGLIVVQVVHLGRVYPRREPGWNLIRRMVRTFVGLALIPVVLICAFATVFIRNSIRSWYAPPVTRVVRTAVELSRASIDDTLKADLRTTRNLAGTLAFSPRPVWPLLLEQLRARARAADVVLLRDNGRILAADSGFPFPLLPPTPSRAALEAARHGSTSVVLAPEHGRRYAVRAVVPIPATNPLARPLALEAVFRVSEHETRTARRVEQAYARYEELGLLRRPLTWSLVLTLILVALLGWLALVTAALYFARRIVAPVDELVGAIGAVADGHFDVRLKTAGDDFGPLKRSFNRMIERLSDAQRVAAEHRQREEHERALLETVLAHLSAGVLVFDERRVLELANDAACRLLGLGRERDVGRDVAALRASHPGLEDFFAAVDELLPTVAGETRREIVLGGGRRRRILGLRVTPLPELPAIGRGGAVVFEDLTDLLEAQHDAAWGEVARRMAHEIRNPLTPIQLTAERIGRRLLRRLNEEERIWLQRSVETIVRQVEALQNMVRAFGDYARAPDLRFTRFDLNALTSEVADLYRGRYPHYKIVTDLGEPAPLIEADEERIRQVLHNLLRNALDALQERPTGHVVLRVRYDLAEGDAELLVEDDGPGFSPAMLEHAFEPYTTSKPRGTGLGLAITKKIIEEHGGHTLLSNRPEGGARVAVVLPLNERTRNERLRAAARRYQRSEAEPL